MKRAFMVMPFSDEIVKKAYEYCVKPIFIEKQIEIRKADEIFSTNPVYDDIIQEIQNAQIIVVDISGKNPNVYYELGISHNLKQSQTIILTHDPHENTPFDIAHFRIIHYDDSIEGSAHLKKSLTQTIDYILVDYKTLYKEEYEIVMKTLSSADKQIELCMLIGLNSIGGIISEIEQIHVEGHNESFIQAFDTVYAKDAFEMFINMAYTKDEGGRIYITDKGKGFTEYLKMHGFVCDIFNEHQLSDGYISPLKNPS